MKQILCQFHCLSGCKSVQGEVDHSKDKKGFDTQSQKPERKSIVSCYENRKEVEDFANTLQYIDCNENPKSHDQIDSKQSNDYHQELKTCLLLGNININKRKRFS